jgi:hypothetical protein
MTSRKSIINEVEGGEHFVLQPEINPVSELIVHKMCKSRPEILNESKVMSNTRMASLRKLKEAEEVVECSFHPTINQSRNRKIWMYTTKFYELYE